jgi:hypothetical protein
MRDFTRRGDLIRLRLGEHEVDLLGSLVLQLSGLLEDGSPAPVDAPADGSGDPFERWQAELAAEGNLDSSDPVIGRLFPDAYAGDPAAAAEFRRFTQTRQVMQRLEQAGTVLDALAATDEGRHRVEVPLARVDDWLRVLTALRLSLAVRLGIESPEDADSLDALDEDDPRSFVYRVYEWLAYLSEGLLTQLGR